jgi:hypothetical protein
LASPGARNHTQKTDQQQQNSDERHVRRHLQEVVGEVLRHRKAVSEQLRGTQRQPDVVYVQRLGQRWGTQKVA